MKIYAYAAIALVVLLIVGAAFYFGTRWDDASDANARADTLERIDNADVSKGDAKADRDWVNDFIDGLSRGD